MQACIYEKHKSPIIVAEVPVPRDPVDGELLVRIRAAALNPVDYKTAAGSHASTYRTIVQYCTVAQIEHNTHPTSPLLIFSFLSVLDGHQ